jgi:hypothetical protein
MNKSSIPAPEGPRPDIEPITAKPFDAPPAIKTITKLEELQGMVNQKFFVDITLAGQDPVRVEGRRLNPAERAITRDMNDSIVPPLIKGATAKDDRNDWSEKGFILARNRMARTTRAMEVYWSYSFIQDGRPNLSKSEDIEKYVQSILSDAVVQALWAGVNDGGIRKVVLVNFTSAESLTN